MAVTRDSLGLTEAASVERQETDAILADPATMAAIREGEADLAERGARRGDFPVGSFVRTRHPLLDNFPIDIGQPARPLDFGQVREGQPDGEFVAVGWAQADCGCTPAQEAPADLVKLTEAEFHLAVAALHTGYNAGYDEALADNVQIPTEG